PCDKPPEKMRRSLQTTIGSPARPWPALTGRSARLPLGYEPGQDWEYSVATDLQAEIVERLTGERFDLFMKPRVFEPLGMRDTAFALNYDQDRRLVRGHAMDAQTGRLRVATMEERLEPIFPVGRPSV